MSFDIWYYKLIKEEEQCQTTTDHMLCDIPKEHIPARFCKMIVEDYIRSLFIDAGFKKKRDVIVWKGSEKC